MMWSFLAESRPVSSFPSLWVEFGFLVFLPDFGLKLLDTTFSIIQGDRLVMGELLVDSMIMNLRKDGSASLSEESNSERLHSSFFLISHMYYLFFHRSFASPPTMESNFWWEFIKGEAYSPWLRQGYTTSILKSGLRF